MGIAAMVGAPIKRREDPRLITGQATYVDDIKLYGMLHMSVLRSPYGGYSPAPTGAEALVRICSAAYWTARTIF